VTPVRENVHSYTLNVGSGRELTHPASWEDKVRYTYTGAHTQLVYCR